MMKFLAALMAKFKRNRSKKPISEAASNSYGVTNLLNQMLRDVPAVNNTSDDDELLSLVKEGIAQCIILQGKNASPETLKNARDLGLDVNSLLLQHKAHAANVPVNANDNHNAERDEIDLISQPQPPEKSILLRRRPATSRALKVAKPFLRPEYIKLQAEKRPDERICVMAMLSSEDEPEQHGFHQETSEHLNFFYPSNDCPNLFWSDKLFDYRTANVEFVQNQLLRDFGLPDNWATPYSTEAVFMMHYTEQSVTDLRRTLISGPSGPAPLPYGAEWPVCRRCGEHTSFCKSLDLRDLAFSDLLPGTTISIFTCSACLQDGHDLECSSILWLPADAQIVLIDRGEPMPILTASQWYGQDCCDFDDLPESMQDFIGTLNPIIGRRLILGESRFPWIPPSLSSKSGGVPRYLSNPVSFRDRLGLDMEYIGQVSIPEEIADGLGYIFHSTSTGETALVFQPF